MSDKRIRPAVIVGIDGSQAAIHAAEWAADEATATSYTPRHRLRQRESRLRRWERR